MGIGKILRAFQPKDKVFYDLFDNIADNLIVMATEFDDAIKNLNEDNKHLYDKLKDIEHKLDQLTHEVYIQLGENFITPFDREDIGLLASRMDDIADYILASSKYILLYNSPVVKEYNQFSEIILNSTIEIKKALTNLRSLKNIKKVKESCIKINEYENIADDILSQGIIDIFATNDAVKIVKVKMVLEYLELVTDKAEDVANTIDNIIIKYS